MLFFVRCLPKAGFRWPEGDKLTSRDTSHQRRDQQIAKILYQHANCPNLAPDGNKTKAVHEVSQALSEMFDQSTALIRSNVNGSSLNTFGFMSGKMRAHVSWGLSVRADTYMELFNELYKARGRWHENPQDPFDPKEHGALAHAIDSFHEAKGGGDWELKSLDKLARAGAFTHEEEELEVKEGADKASGDGPADTTLTPLVMLKMLVENSQQQGLMERKDEEGDVEMKDEENEENEEGEDDGVREMRERLAQTNLDEVMDVESDEWMDLI